MRPPICVCIGLHKNSCFYQISITHHHFSLCHDRVHPFNFNSVCVCRYGRVNYVLARRLELLREVGRLQESLDVPGDVSYTCETAGHFHLYQVRLTKDVLDFLLNTMCLMSQYSSFLWNNQIISQSKSSASEYPSDVHLGINIDFQTDS